MIFFFFFFLGWPRDLVCFIIVQYMVQYEHCIFLFRLFCCLFFFFYYSLSPRMDTVFLPNLISFFSIYQNTSSRVLNQKWYDVTNAGFSHIQCVWFYPVLFVLKYCLSLYGLFLFHLVDSSLSSTTHLCFLSLVK